ncbi:cobyric acid synthase [Clostridium tertium]|uniref:Cobyric acid synthase n=1 Tax=Clostridium tertium TaxID=1559 RepID=A0A6N3FEW1_9CLOT
MSKSIMLLGTASSVGKSTIATAFCRYFKNKGLKVAPFKALNISLNSYVTKEGLEMGRAQVVQAEACEIEPESWMNPILLKPSGNNKTQVIVNGKVKCNMDAYKYKDLNRELKEVVKDIYDKESENFDLIVLEGSGSCAEINLRENDIANMSMAEESDSPVILVADIDRGGVFASIVGTIMLLDEKERSRVKGVIINKFRGNVESFKPAMKQLEDIINIPVLGVMPYVDIDIEDEDSVTDRFKGKDNKDACIDIAIIKLASMSNFTDFNALGRLKSVNLRYVEEANEIGSPDLIIIPGSKNTIKDLKIIKEKDIFNKILELENRGTIIIGICGGYQMLGKLIEDPLSVEGNNKYEEGFKFLNTRTSFSKDKRTKQVKGIISKNKVINSEGVEVEGYEIHNGVTTIEGNINPFITLDTGEIAGIINDKQNVIGTYLHGIFDNEDFLKELIKHLLLKININDVKEEITSYKEYKKGELDKLSNILSSNIDMKKVEEIINN